MRKLTLDLGALTVQSFATDDAAARLFGTVHGRHKGHTGLQDTDCSAVDACESAMVECPRTRKDCPSNDPCSDFVACSEIGCSEQGCHQTRGCSHGHQCDPSRKEPCISERECTQVDCPVGA